MIKCGPTIIAPIPAELPADADIARSPANANARTVRSITSDALLGARGELKIEHNGEQYSLRRTRQGKLILTK